MQKSVKPLLPLALVFCGAVSCDRYAPKATLRDSHARYAITDLGTLGGGKSRAFGINDSGDVVGEADVLDGASNSLSETHAFLWREGRMTDLHVLPGPEPDQDPGDSSRAESINNRGEVGGEAQVDAYSIHDPRSRLWAGGRWTWVVPDGQLLLGLPGSEAYKINGSGTIAGRALDDPPPALGPESPVYRAKPFLLSGGRVRSVDYLYGFGINNRGDLCGCVKRGGQIHVVLRQRGRERDLGTLTALGGPWVAGIVLNDKAVIAGTLTDLPEDSGDQYADDAPSRSARAVWWRQGAWRLLQDLPGYPTSVVHGLNDAEQIVGEAYQPYPKGGSFLPLGVAVLWERGEARDLNRLIPRASGWTLESATGINNRGQIVGYGSIGDETHGFLLTPARHAEQPPPLPATVSPPRAGDPGHPDPGETFPEQG